MMVSTFLLYRYSIMAMAKAAPSVGSVPTHTSSTSTRSPSRTSSRMEIMFFMWPEKVDRLCSMLCSSPISA